MVHGLYASLVASLRFAIEGSVALLQEAQEATAAGEAERRELAEANARLQAHIGDLETRKRAPLYQKKQEEVRRLTPSRTACSPELLDVEAVKQS